MFTQLNLSQFSVSGVASYFYTSKSFRSSDLYALMAGNYQTKVLFETLESQEKGETTALQGRTHPSQQQFFALLGALVR